MVNKLSDVNVVLDIKKPAITDNLGTLAIFTPGSEETVKTYKALDDMDDITDTAVLKVAEGYFAQNGHSKDLMVITYKNLNDTLNKSFYEKWEFATVVAAPTTPPEGGNSDGGETLTLGADDLTVFSNFVEGQARKFLVNGLIANDDTFSKAEDTKQKFFGNTRTILFAVGADEDAKNYGVGALVGALGNRTVGSITWKFKSLSGVSVTDYNAAQVDKLIDNGIITYINKAGIEQTSEGITVSGDYIDQLHGDDWIKTNIEGDLQKLLSSTDKLTYDARGIAQIEAVATAVLLTGTENDVVLRDDSTGAGIFEVKAETRADSTAEDIANRAYTGLSFTYQRGDAIHTITVHGTVEL